MFDASGLWEGLGSLPSWLLDAGQLDGWSSDDVFSPWDQHQGMVGTPEHDAAIWRQQGTDFTCAVVSQQMILQQFGIEVSEAQLVYDAVTNGWLTDAGTSIGDLGRLLEHYGVDTHHGVGGGIESLMSELVQGHSVIVAVDADDMWESGSLSPNLLPDDGVDHAVVVTGLDLSDPEHPQVYINDPGDPSGAGRAYPLEQFLDAWADSGDTYVATDDAPPGLAQHEVLGTQYRQESNMYMDESFWSQWLESALRDFDIEVFKTSLMVMGNAVGAPATYAVMDSLWDRLDDTGRNKLFLMI